jgi:hypothetical protein
MIDTQFGLKTTFSDKNIVVESESSGAVTLNHTSQVLFSRLDDDLDEALRGSFPASDPISSLRSD